MTHASIVLSITWAMRRPGIGEIGKFTQDEVGMESSEWLVGSYGPPPSFQFMWKIFRASLFRVRLVTCAR